MSAAAEPQFQLQAKSR